MSPRPRRLRRAIHYTTQAVHCCKGLIWGALNLKVGQPLILNLFLLGDSSGHLLYRYRRELLHSVLLQLNRLFIKSIYHSCFFLHPFITAVQDGYLLYSKLYRVGFVAPIYALNPSLSLVVEETTLMLSVLPPVCCMFYSINNVNVHCETNKEGTSHVILYTDEYFHHTRRSLILRVYLHRQQPKSQTKHTVTRNTVQSDLSHVCSLRS